MTRILAWGTLATSALLLAATSLAGEVPVVDAFSIFAGHAAGAIASATLALLLPRRLALAGLAAGLLATLFAHAAIGLRPLAIAAEASLPRPAALKVVHANTWHAQHDTTDLEVYLAGTDADVVALVEFGPSKLALLQKLKRTYPHQASCADRWHCSVVLLSRHPLLAQGLVMPTHDKPPLVWARVAAPGGVVTVAAMHVFRPTRNPWTHVRQLAGLADWARAVDGPLILAGDFNAGQGSHAMARFLAVSGLTPAHGFLPSWPAWPIGLPQIAIDHILISKGLEGASAGLGPAIGSDHFPLWATIARGRQG